MRKVIINGANGFVASNFIVELLNQNYYVIALVRGEDDAHARKRMLNALNKLDKNESFSSKKLTVYNYSLLDTDFSISPEHLSEIFGDRVDYFHFAASLKFSEKKKDEIFETNISGVENSIKVFEKYTSEKSRFFFISTAYSCGKTDKKFEERFYENEEIINFRNYYEQSKRRAENVVKNHIENNGLNAFIIRPSQVVGNSLTGITITDLGIFDFIKRIYTIANRYPEETIRIKADPGATQNLIPIDTLVFYLIRTVKVFNMPVVINFVAKQPVKNKHIIDCINDILPIKIVFCKKLDINAMTPIERQVNAGMSFTSSYCDTKLRFSTKNLDKLIVSKGNEINTISLWKMIYYFIDNVLINKETYNINYAD